MVSRLKWVLLLRYKMRVLVIFLLLGMSTKGFTQYVELGAEYGYSSYFGDLAPYSWKASLQPSDVSTGFSIGYGFNESVAVYVSYVYTTLSGDDKNAVDNEWRKNRNLQFRSPIYEYGILAELNLRNVITPQKNYKWFPYVVTGLNYYRFNPQALYQGQWIDLQPLGTEGQGSPEYPSRSKYPLNQINIPIGFGAKYFVTRNILVGLGIKFRWTFTDYLDDVSSTFVDLDLLEQANGSLAAELAYRSDELPESSLPYTVGQGRGNALNNDWYLTTYFTIGYRFYKWPKKEKKVNCPKF